jgi:hypothetical protein
MYLFKIDEVMEKEFRFARLEDLREITPNVPSLKAHLNRAEHDGFIRHREDKGEHNYLKTRRGRKMEEILLYLWPYINSLDRGWHGDRMHTEPWEHTATNYTARTARSSLS